MSGFSKGIKTDIVSHRYSLLDEIQIVDSYRLASLADISAMKINAITNRGARKDFIDLYFILKDIPIEEVLGNYRKKYKLNDDFTALMSLVYV